MNVNPLSPAVRKIDRFNDVISVTNVSAFQSSTVYNTNIPVDDVISVTPIISSNSGGYMECLHVAMYRNFSDKLAIRAYSLTAIPNTTTLKVSAVVEHL